MRRIRPVRDDPRREEARVWRHCAARPRSTAVVDTSVATSSSNGTLVFREGMVYYHEKCGGIDQHWTICGEIGLEFSKPLSRGLKYWHLEIQQSVSRERSALEMRPLFVCCNTRNRTFINIMRKCRSRCVSFSAHISVVYFLRRCRLAPSSSSARLQAAPTVPHPLWQRPLPLVDFEEILHSACSGFCATYRVR